MKGNGGELATKYADYERLKFRAEQEIRKAVEARISVAKAEIMHAVAAQMKEGKSIASLSRDIGISRPTLYRWLGEYEGSVDQAISLAANGVAPLSITPARFQLAGGGYANQPWIQYRYQVRDNMRNTTDWVNPGSMVDSWEWSETSTAKGNLPAEVLALKPENAKAAFDIASEEERAKWMKWTNGRGPV